MQSIPHSKIQPFQKYIFLWLVLFCGFIGTGQNSCECRDTALPTKLFPQSIVDSISTFNLSVQLKTLDDNNCLFHAYNIEYNYVLEQRHLERALALLNKMEQLNNNLQCGTEFDLIVMLNKAKYYHKSNDFEALSEYGLNALRKAQDFPDRYYEIEVLKELIWLYTRMDEDETLWNYVKRAELLIHDQTINDISLAINYRWLGYQYENRYTKTGDSALINSAWSYITKAKKIALKHNLTGELTRNYRALEALSYHKRELTKALVYIDSAIYFGKQIKGTKNLSGLYLSKAWDHYELDQFIRAEKWTDTMLAVDTQTDVAGYMMTLSQASELYEKTGNNAKALKTFKAYTALKDSLFSKERLKTVNELDKKYQTELKDAQLKIKDNRITRLSIISIFCALIAILIFLFYKMKQLRDTKKVNTALQNAMDTQLKLEKEITNVRENIAQDFHDELGNKLARISLLSSLIQNDPTYQNYAVKTKIQQITDDAKSLYMGTRDFIFSLKSSSDCLEEVVTYLSDFGEDFFSKSAIRFEIHRDLEKNIKLPFYWSKQLVYIFKEAITNSYKHSDCTEVKLSFTIKNDILHITLSDNGKGINEAQITSKNGIAYMKTRADKIGGELQILPIKPRGTIVSFKGKTT
jgi:signal transduction histidine kinase